MPEFRRGLGRWLPREAARDLFHPSLEDLRAANPGRVRLRLATLALWLDCWRVWLMADRPGPPRGRRHGQRFRKDYFAMFLQDARRAFRLFRLESGFTAAA